MAWEEDRHDHSACQRRGEEWRDRTHRRDEEESESECESGDDEEARGSGGDCCDAGYATAIAIEIWNATWIATPNASCVWPRVLLLPRLLRRPFPPLL